VAGASRAKNNFTESPKCATIETPWKQGNPITRFNRIVSDGAGGRLGMAQQLLDSDSMDEFERQMDRMIHTFFPHEHRTRSRLWHPPTDMYETEEAAVVKIEAAGMEPDDFTVSFVNRTLIVRGVRKDTEEKQSFLRLEILYGEFQIEVNLADSYRADQIQAKYDRGFLYITLPKSKEEHRVPIRVQTASES
jgi:HSP20 family molecular chaperone IbpA